MRRDTKRADPFYASAAWRRVRRAVLMRDNYMCVRCMQALREGTGGRPRAATLVHHIVPYQDAPERGLELDNLESLCDVCHNRIHAALDRKRVRLQADAPHDTAKHVRIIRI